MAVAEAFYNSPHRELCTLLGLEVPVLDKRVGEMEDAQEERRWYRSAVVHIPPQAMFHRTWTEDEQKDCRRLIADGAAEAEAEARMVFEAYRSLEVKVQLVWVESMSVVVVGRRAVEEVQQQGNSIAVDARCIWVVVLDRQGQALGRRENLLAVVAGTNATLMPEAGAEQVGGSEQPEPSAQVEVLPLVVVEVLASSPLAATWRCFYLMVERSSMVLLTVAPPQRSHCTGKIWIA